MLSALFFNPGNAGSLSPRIEPSKPPLPEDKPGQVALEALRNQNIPSGNGQLVVLPPDQIALYNRRRIDAPGEVAARLKKAFNAAQEKMYFLVDYFECLKTWDLADPDAFQSKDKILLKDGKEYGNTILTTACDAPELGVCCTQGWKPSMEDTHVFSEFTLSTPGGDKPVKLFGVFDGHNGSGCAKYLATEIEQRLHNSLEAELKKQECSEEVAIYNVLTQAFVELGEEWVDMKDPSKSTALIALMIGNELWTANVGDCRAILLDGNNTIALSRDAKLFAPKGARPTEALSKNVGMLKFLEGKEDKSLWKSVFKRGGELYLKARSQFYRVCEATCNMLRAVGYPAVGFGINPRAEVIKYVPTPGNKLTLILVSDGISDWASIKGTAQFVWLQLIANPAIAPYQIAEKLVKKACQATLKEGKLVGDNITVIVADLGGEKKEEEEIKGDG